MIGVLRLESLRFLRDLPPFAGERERDFETYPEDGAENLLRLDCLLGRIFSEPCLLAEFLRGKLRCFSVGAG